MIYTAGKGSHSSVVEFDCPKVAQKAKEEFDSWLLKMSSGGSTTHYGYSLIINNPPTFRSLFKEMLVANPYGDLKEMMQKAKEAIKMMEEKSMEDF